MINKIIAWLILALSFFTPSLWCSVTGLDESEFEYMAQVIEAESDRSSGCTYGKVLIGSTIWNRVHNKQFKNTVGGVLDESGQFTTTSGGRCGTKATNGSRMAVVISYICYERRLIQDNILFFNCIGYNGYTPYDYVGGNYFMTSGQKGESYEH